MGRSTPGHAPGTAARRTSAGPRHPVGALLALLLAVGGLSAARPAWAEDAADGARYRRLVVVDVRGEIEPVVGAYLERSLEAAAGAGADAVVLRIESPGGRGDVMERMIDAVLAVPATVRTVAWIEKSAYSAAALVALACDEIVMAPGARMGDAQPIFLTGEGIVPAGEKIETVARALVRKLAERKGWDPVLCEKFVSKDREVVEVRRKGTDERRYVYADELTSARDDDLVGGVPRRELERVRVVVAADRLLTLTTNEAKDFGFVRRVKTSEEALLAALKADGATVTNVTMAWHERASRFLLGLTGVLGALVVLCAGLSLFRGIGTATVVGLAALALIAMVTWTADLPHGFALLLVLVGLVLLAVEALLLPGFGVAGVLGIAATVAGFLFLSTGFTLDRPGTLSWETAGVFAAQFAGTLLAGSVFLVLLSRLVPSLPFARRHLHLPDGGLPAGPVGAPEPDLVGVGAAGVASTDLRPAGRATFAGRPVDVTSEGGFVEAGTAVRVLRVEGPRVFVRPSAPEAGSAAGVGAAQRAGGGTRP